MYYSVLSLRKVSVKAIECRRWNNLKKSALIKKKNKNVDVALKTSLFLRLDPLFSSYGHF